MNRMQRRSFLKAAAAVAVGGASASAAEKPAVVPLTLIVMDPLAAPLSCPCVKGYAQRDYNKLAEYLSERLCWPVVVHYGESLKNTLEKKSGGKADIIIGKASVVRHEAKENKITPVPLAALSGKDGKTTQTGLVVVAAKDAALSAADLKDHKIIFGESSAEEKYSAAISLLKDLGVTTPASPTTCLACSDGATKVIEAHKKGEKIATVISSYAQPLLEGCGTIQKGDLRVVGETDPVPFIVAFANESLSMAYRNATEKALLGLAADKALCTALETKDGFVALPAKKK